MKPIEDELTQLSELYDEVYDENTALQKSLIENRKDCNEKVNIKLQQLVDLVKLKTLALAVAINPDFVSGWKLKAEVERDLLLYSEAIASYGMYLKLCPKDFEAWTTVGAILNAIAKSQEALQCFDKAIALSPGFIPAILNKGYACSRLARYEDAIESYDEVLYLVPGHYQALLNKGHSWQFLGQSEKAVACYLDAITANPDNCREATTNLVNCRIQMRFESAKVKILTFEQYLKAKYN